MPDNYTTPITISLFNFLIISTLICASQYNANAQIMYQNVTHKDFALGSYGRVGINYSFDNGGSIGRRLNLNNMGSIGGRLEEQDYLEIAPSIRFKPKDGDSTFIYAQVRLAVYSLSLTGIGNSSTASLGGLTFAMPEIYAEARNIKGKDLSMWIGARLYRGPDVHIADHFFFNDHSAPGFGIEFNKTRLAAFYVSSTDTTATVPPYFYLNIRTGTPSAELRQRGITVVEQDIDINKDNRLTLLGEFHRMADASAEPEIEPFDTLSMASFPSDYGFVLGIRHNHDLRSLLPGSFNQFSLRYGSGIANGGDGGLSRTWLTFGAPDTLRQNFRGAYSWALVNHFVLNFDQKNTLNGYVIMTNSKGAANTNHISKTYFGREVFNRKLDFTVGARHEYYINDYFHFLTELHYSQRKDGTNPLASMVKISLAPIYVPTGQRDTWARPHLRFVVSFARYNDFAMESLYSPYLEFVGQKRWGHYLGVKAEWWIFN